MDARRYRSIAYLFIEDIEKIACTESEVKSIKLIFVAVTGDMKLLTNTRL